MLLIRHGLGTAPAGGGFSWTDYNFVALSRAGSSTPNVFAHEVGHYLGLSHTFNRIFKTVAEAESFVSRQGYSLDMFRGDAKCPDTAPTPYIEELEQTTADSIVLSGHRFRLQVGNIMSFYNGRPPMTTNSLTPDQFTRVRLVAVNRLAHRMHYIEP